MCTLENTDVFSYDIDNDMVTVNEGTPYFKANSDYNQLTLHFWASKMINETPSAKTCLDIYKNILVNSLTITQNIDASQHTIAEIYEMSNKDNMEMDATLLTALREMFMDFSHVCKLTFGISDTFDLMKLSENELMMLKKNKGIDIFYYSGTYEIDYNNLQISHNNGYYLDTLRINNVLDMEYIPFAGKIRVNINTWDANAPVDHFMDFNIYDIVNIDYY